MFSIVIPLYNKASSIKKTVYSVLDQTYPNFEIIIVNDGSTDESLEEIATIHDKRLRVVNKQNGGVSSARNRGILEAQYDWIAFLDADDLWLNRKLEVFKNAIDQNPKLKWLFSGYTVLNKNQKKLNVYNGSGILEDVIDDLNKGLMIHTSSVIIKNDVFKDNRFLFTIGINNSEDREVWYKMACKYPSPFYIKDSLAFYILDQTGNSLTSRVSKRNQENFHFLDLERRLSSVFEETEEYRVNNIMRFIRTLNRKAIIGYWIRNRKSLPSIFEPHLAKMDFFVFKSTIWLPVLAKRIFIKIYKVFMF